MMPAESLETVAQKRFYLTDHVCACGFGIRLSNKLVDAGKAFIWGHKGGAGKIHSKSAHIQSAPRPGPVTTTNMSQVLGFLKENETLLAGQEGDLRRALGEAREQADAMELRLAVLVERRNHFISALNSLGAVQA